MNEAYTRHIDENGHCVFPEGIAKIELYTFSYCENLRSITIPNSVIIIGNDAFIGCENLQSITIPNSVTYIGERAFYCCTNLKLVEISNSITSIAENTFLYCHNLKTLKMPEKSKYADWFKKLMIPAGCKIEFIKETQEESKTLTELSKTIHENAVAHGWWERGVDFPTIVALCHAELSEALEEYRNGNPNFYFISNGFKSEDIDEIGEEKPEGIAVEMIDCVIRILDWCGQNGIDVDRLVEIKNEYNKTRSYRHGGKVC